MTQKIRRGILIVAMAASVVLILWITLFSRIGNESRHLYPPFWSYAAIAQGNCKALFGVLGNVLLIVPVSIITGMRGKRLMNKKVLVIAAHPDDELLGCGATVAVHVENGDCVHSIILCEGETMRSQNGEEKRTATEDAAKVLGVEIVHLIGLPDQHLDAIPIVDVITPIENVVKEFKPNIIYLHSGSDINKDHQIVFEASLVALRPKNLQIEDIYSFYTVGATEWGYPRCFSPDTWIGFDERIMQQKLKAFSCYETELCDYPHPRSLEAIKNLAKMTGNQCCMEYAEAFETIRRTRR